MASQNSAAEFVAREDAWNAATRPDWSENKAAELVAQIKRSRYATPCFGDAADFMADGYAADVALAMAWKYWR